MHIQPSPSSLHPSWCDPRVCRADDLNYYCDHRSTPLEWTPSVDNYAITTGLARFDGGGGPIPCAGVTTARLELRDLVDDNPDGTPRVMGVDLTAADARLLTAALVAVAEQLEAEQRRTVTR